VKTVTTREFYHTPSLVKSMSEGQTVLVTSNGKPDFIVKKAGKRLRKTAAEMRREARETFPEDRPKVDTVAFLRELRK
jgi:antitoxin (DNA-binding transcriptional repressor) of toxin-antitoxin stability system